MTAKKTRTPRKEPRWKFLVYCLTIVGIIVAGVLITQTLERIFP